MSTFPRALVRLAVGAMMCLHVSPVAAQSPTGTVAGDAIDERTGKPLPGVLISIEQQAASVEADAEGRFTIALAPGRYTVTASLVGYALGRQDVEVRAAVETTITFRLAEGAGTYAEHVMVSGRATDAAESAPGGAELHGRELQNLRGVMLDDPLRAMQSLPSVTATDDFYSEFAVRGSTFRHVGLAIDGIPSRYLMHTVHGVTDGGSIAMVNSETLGAVSLLPGSYPQRTGRSLGAQVDLSTREGSRESFRGRAGLSGTSAAAVVEGPIGDGRGSWLVSARRSYLDLLIKQIDPEADFAFGFTDVQGKVVYDLAPAHQIQVTTLAGRAGFSEDEPAALGANDEASARSLAWLGSLSWRYTPGARFLLTQRLYTTGLRFHNDNNTSTVLDRGRFADAGWRADASFAMRDATRLEFGADAGRLAFTRERRRFLDGSGAPRLLGEDASHALVAGSYAQVRTTLRPWLIVTPGARIDHWGITRESTASPWIQGEARLGAHTRLRAATGVHRQFPRFEQVYGVNGGGTSLRPERAHHVDAGLERQLTDDTRLQLTWYQRREHDVLWTPGAEPQRDEDLGVLLGRADARWVNTLDGRARGVEVVLRRDAPAGLSGWIGYAHGRLRYTDASRGESFWSDADQRHTLAAYAHYRISNRSTVGAKYRYGSNYPIAGYIGEPRVAASAALFGGAQPIFLALTDARNTLRLPAYSRLDLRADRTFNRAQKRFTLFVEVANILNRSNQRNASYGFDRAGRVFGATEPLMPIIPSAGFVVEF